MGVHKYMYCMYMCMCRCACSREQGIQHPLASEQRIVSCQLVSHRPHLPDRPYLREGGREAERERERERYSPPTLTTSHFMWHSAHCACTCTVPPADIHWPQSDLIQWENNVHKYMYMPYKKQFPQSGKLN